jgi:hypothetical protein
MESVAQVSSVLLTIRLDKTQSITLMHGTSNQARDHQAKYHHRSCWEHLGGEQVILQNLLQITQTWYIMVIKAVKR